MAVSRQHLRQEPTGQDAAGLFALLGTPTHTPAATAALADRPEYSTEAALDRLLDARPFEPAGPGRYRMHDLVHLSAREQAAETLGADARAAAVHRVSHHYPATARTASLLLNPASVIVRNLRPDRPGLGLDTPQQAVDSSRSWPSG